MARVGRPDGAAAAVGDDVGEVVAGLQVAHRDRVEFGAGIVMRPGEQPVVGRMARAADAEEGAAGGERIAVEENLLAAAPAFRT